MTKTIKSQEQQVLEAKCAVKSSKHYNGEYCDESCWAHLRVALPNASDEYLQTVADRVELAMTD